MISPMKVKCLAIKNLSDIEIAAILNYIRTEFANSQGNLIPVDSAHQRKGMQ